MDKKELDILIDKSIFGTLTQTEKEKLDAYIMEQPTTKLEIQLRTDIMKGLEYNSDQELKGVLEKIHNETIVGPTGSPILKKLAYALLFIAILFGAYTLYNNMSQDTLTESNKGPVIYASYFEPFEASTETRSTDSDQDASTKLFLEAYQAEDYQSSLQVFETLSSQADNNMFLLAGISAMELNKNEESLTFLNKIIDSNDFYFVDHAKWYKALALLKTNQINQAKEILNDLASNPKADHHDDSISLLEEI